MPPERARQDSLYLSFADGTLEVREQRVSATPDNVPVSFYLVRNRTQSWPSEPVASSVAQLRKLSRKDGG